MIIDGKEWRLVPVEAVREMLDAAHFGPNCAEEGLSASDEKFWIDVWNAMLNSAPQPPEVVVSDEMAKKVAHYYHHHPVRNSNAADGRDMIDAVQSILGPTLGLVTREDVAWLMACQPSLERDHILAILQCSESREYDRPPAPVAAATQFVAGEVDDAMCDSAYISKWRGVPGLIGHEPDDEDRQWSREWLEAWRAELGPTLGLVEIREPTPEECERICTAYERLLMRVETCGGRDAFDAVRAVMWPKEGL